MVCTLPAQMTRFCIARRARIDKNTPISLRPDLAKLITITPGPVFFASGSRRGCATNYRVPRFPETSRFRSEPAVRMKKKRELHHAIILLFLFAYFLARTAGCSVERNRVWFTIGDIVALRGDAFHWK